MLYEDDRWHKRKAGAAGYGICDVHAALGKG